MARSKVKGKVKVSVKKRPLKAGSTDTKSGGILTSKVIAIAKKKEQDG